MRRHRVQVYAVSAVVVEVAVGDEHLLRWRLAPNASVAVERLDVADLDRGSGFKVMDVALAAARGREILDEHIGAAPRTCLNGHGHVDTNGLPCACT